MKLVYCLRVTKIHSHVDIYVDTTSSPAVTVTKKRERNVSVPEKSITNPTNLIGNSKKTELLLSLVMIMRLTQASPFVMGDHELFEPSKSKLVGFLPWKKKHAKLKGKCPKLPKPTISKA